MILEKFLKFLKAPLKRIYSLIPEKIRYSKTFWDTYNFLNESQWWSSEKIEEYQFNKLSALLEHSYENIPYYRKIFDQRSIKPQNIRNFEDLKKIPFLTKEIIRNNLNDLVARNFRKSQLYYCTTGGSTGIPLGIYHEKYVTADIEWAYMLMQWSRVGFKVGDRSVILRGTAVGSVERQNLWEYNPTIKSLILSPYHLSECSIVKYLNKIREFEPDYFQAYPSLITILARFMKANGISPFKSIKAILCGSEHLYQWQRKLLEDAFGCRVYSWYGHSEQVVLAGECEVSNYYHIFPEYGIIEPIEKNEINHAEGNLHEMVSTGLNNYVCPLIRYRTMDLAEFSDLKCECGRNHKLIKKIEGRMQELVITKNDIIVSLTSLIFAQHFNAFSKIREMQLIQEKKGEIIVKISKINNYDSSDEKEIFDKLSQAVNNGLDIFFEYVDCIPRAPNGKYKFLIQKLNFIS